MCDYSAARFRRRRGRDSSPNSRVALPAVYLILPPCLWLAGHGFGFRRRGQLTGPGYEQIARLHDTGLDFTSIHYRLHASSKRSIARMPITSTFLAHAPRADIGHFSGFR